MGITLPSELEITKLYFNSNQLMCLLWTILNDKYFLFRSVGDPSLTAGSLQVILTLLRDYMALRIDQDSPPSQRDHILPGLQADRWYVFPRGRAVRSQSNVCRMTTYLCLVS